MFEKWHFSKLFKSNLFVQLERVVQLRPADTVKFIFMTGILGIGSYLLTGYVDLKLIRTLMYAASISSTMATLLFIKEYHRFLPLKWSVDGSQLEDGECKDYDGNVIATIEHKDNLPILKLQSKSPYMQGVALVRSMPDQVIESWDRYYALLQPALALFHKLQYLVSRITRRDVDISKYKGGVNAYIKKLMEEVKFQFPPNIVRRIEGFVDEINRHIEDENRRFVLQKKLMTVGDIKQLIVTPDALKMLGCSAHIVKHPDGSKVLGRTLDWEGFGHVAQHTLGIVFPTGHAPDSDRPKSFLSVTFAPGFATMSASNGYISMTLNEATTQQTKVHTVCGYSQLVIFHMIMENCKTVAEVEAFLTKNKPATSCILTVMGKEDGSIFQLLPNDGSNRLFSRRKFDGETPHLHVTNHFFDDHGRFVEGSAAWPDTHKRFATQERALKEAVAGTERLRRLSQPVTVHAMLIKHTEIERALGGTTEFREQVMLRLHVAHRFAGRAGSKYNELDVTAILSSFMLTFSDAEAGDDKELDAGGERGALVASRTTSTTALRERVS